LLRSCCVLAPFPSSVYGRTHEYSCIHVYMDESTSTISQWRQSRKKKISVNTIISRQNEKKRTCTPFRYIYFWNLQFLNNVIINKTNVPHRHAEVTLGDFGYPVLSLWFYCSQNFKLFGFLICRFWVYQKRVVRTKFDIYVSIA
jgi:hypothetical protein